jgi:pSer/pThr/pTyr-binding forkhead associated (FHA) protein
MPPDVPFFVFRDPGGRRQLFEPSDEASRFTIGRRSTCDVALPWDIEVSRLHAELVRLGADIVVQDEGLSHNGTFVNGERVHGRRRIHPGDTITVGATAIEVCGVERTTSVRTRDAHAEAPAPDLTPAQRRVLDALARPMREDRHAAPAPNKRIADELHLSVDTVKGTLSALYERYGLTTVSQNEKRAALAQRALSEARSG